MNRLCAQNDATTDKGRLAILRAMAEAVHKTGNSVVVDTHAQKTALRLGVAPEAVRAEFTKIARSAKPAFTPAASASEDYLPNDAEADAHAHAADGATEVEIDEPLAPPNPQEHWLLRLLLADDDAAPWLAAHLNLEWIPHPHVREIISRRLAAEASGQWRGLAAFLHECATPALQQLICETSAETRTIPNHAQQLSEVVERLRQAHSSQNRNKLANSQVSPEKIAILQSISGCEKRIAHLLSEYSKGFFSDEEKTEQQRVIDGLRNYLATLQEKLTTYK